MFGENKIMHHLIVMDDVSGIADSLKKIADFLTVIRQYRYHYIYIFNIIIPDKEIQTFGKKFISNEHFKYFFS